MSTRYVQDFGGQISATGTATVASEGDPTEGWRTVTVVARASNSPAAQWRVQMGSGGVGQTLAARDIGFGSGFAIAAGPFDLAPGEVIILTVTGGVANDTISASLLGAQGIDANNVYGSPIVGVSQITNITGSVTVPGTVNVTGTVSISGTVTVTGTVNIGTVSGTVTVTGSVTVSGTVNIGTVSGTVTVTGTVNIGTVSGTVTVTGSVTVSGTVSISGTVTVSGTVSISGTVTVSGTVSISGTVTITGSVSITGTVTISGSVTFTNSQIAVLNVAGNLLNTQQPQTALTNLVFPSGGLNVQTTAIVPTGTHSLGVQFPATFTGLQISALKVVGHTTGIAYLPTDASLANINPAPFDELVFNVDSVQDTQYDVTISNTTGANYTVRVTAYLDASAVWVQNAPSLPLFIIGAPTLLQTVPVLIANKRFSGLFASPAAGTKATVSLTANAGKQWVCNYALGAYRSVTSVTVDEKDVNLIDGATGGTAIWGTFLTISAVAGNSAPYNGHIDGGGYAGTPGNAMTLEFSAAPIANSAQRVNLGAHLEG